MTPALTRAPEGGTEVFGRRYAPGEFLPFYIPRSAMPQVDEKDLPALLKWMREEGVAVDYRVVDPARLIRPHQRIDERKVRRIDERLFISADLYILDGHHRWEAHVERSLPVPCYEFDALFPQAVRMILQFPLTYTYGSGHNQVERN